MNEPWYGKRMDSDEIEQFLNEQGTGVLCFAKDRSAYGIPVAFAYDAEQQRAILDLGFAPDSKKRAFIETTDEVCLTTYQWSGPQDWKSVVMSGPFEPLADEAIDDDIQAWFYTVAKDIDIEDGGLELQWHELRAAELSGRAVEAP